MSAFTTVIEHGIAIITFDLPGDSVNKLGATSRDEFEALFIRLRDDASVRGIVVISGKPDTFIAGADIDEFTRITTQAEAERASFEGQELIGRIEGFTKPVVAAIHGACLGAGLEFALACHYRIATDHPKTLLGLPEIQIGLLPGAGGCQRLPRLIGLRAALDIILVGKSVPASKARRLGMVDELVHPSILRQVAVATADRLTREGIPVHRPTPGGIPGLLLDRTPIGRRVVYEKARKQVLEKTHGHYPAPLAALDAVRVGLEEGMAAGLAQEHRAFGELAVTDVARKLIGIFFATTALKKDDGVPPGSGTPMQVRRLGVVGAGFMGAGIAGTAVLKVEVDTRLKDTELDKVGRGLGIASKMLRDRLERRRLTRHQHERLSGLLSGGADYRGFARADLVIEAVFEDLELKRKVLGDVEGIIRPDAIFATNTSTIPIHLIAAGAQHPERVLGMHFFSPVDRMPLLEIIPSDATSADAIVTAVRFGRRMGKTVIVVADSPGFWVNRLLGPYLHETSFLLQEGVPIDVIDDAALRWGFPVGPMALLDEVGLDVAQKAGGVLHEAFGDRLKPLDALGKAVAAGRLGRKSGLGFYRYAKGRKAGVDETIYPQLGVRLLEDVDLAEVQRRLVYRLLNEAAMAYAEGVVRNPRDGDIGAIFGFGFAPFRGGPLRTIDDLGADRVVETLYGLVDRYGSRFEPAAALVAMANAGSRFYPI